MDAQPTRAILIAIAHLVAGQLMSIRNPRALPPPDTGSGADVAPDVEPTEPPTTAQDASEPPLPPAAEQPANT